MAEEFKSHLEKYLLDILSNIGEQTLIEKFQDEYDKLMDEFIKQNFLPKEKIDSIVEDSLSDSVKQINELKEEKASLTKQNNELAEKNKILNIKNEEIAQKFSVLEKSLNKSTNDLKNITILEQKLNELQADYDLLKSQYAAKQDEISMYKKNLKKYYSMEKEIKQLTSENEKLSIKMRELSSADNYKLKFEEVSQLNEKMKIENTNLNKQNYKYKQEIELLANELEQTKEKLDKVENEKKLKNYQLEEKIKENIKIINEKEDIMARIKEAEYNLKTNKIMIENQNKEFKKEIDKLRQENNILKKEKEFLNKELQKFKTYTNMAKVSRETLSKKDFSLLETMSRRVEESESLTGNLKQMIQRLDNINSNLKDRNEKLENIILFYMKERGEFKDIDEIDENLRGEKGFQEISEMKYDREVLLNMVFKLKQEIIKVNQNLQQITVEANTRIRDLTEQSKK
jgi:chromosome segregation ATPase